MRTLVAALVLTFLATAASSSEPTESEQRAACSGDVFRLCLIHIVDRDRIGRCMVENRTRLTPECKRVVDATISAKRGTH